MSDKAREIVVENTHADLRLGARDADDSDERGVLGVSFVCGRAVEDFQALAAVKRSP